MSQKYPGGIISKTAPVTVGPVDGEGGSAPGIWTLTQALELQKQNLWPKPLIAGELYAWGKNNYGQLGISPAGYATNRSSPTQVGALTSWSNIAGGGNHSLAVKIDGTLWAWGYNSSGQLGQNNTINSSSPVQIGALTEWTKIAATSASALAIKTNGTLWAWGNNFYGILGLGDSTGNNRSSPVQVGSLTNWAQVSGNGCSVAVKTDGTLWAWGRNNSGQLGQNDTVSRSSPVQVGALTGWSKAYASNNAVVAVKTNGTLWAWGDNAQGQLGQNDTIARSSPVQVGALTNWLKLSVGNFSTIVAIKTDNTFWAWGRNNGGQLGFNNTANVSSPTQVGSLTNWAIPAAGNDHVVAIKTDNTLWACGGNNLGELGENNTISRSSPVQIGSVSDWLKVSAGQNHSLAITKG